MTIDPFDWAVIVHEAGHLTVASRLGLDVRKVDLVWENGWLNGYSYVIEGSQLTGWLVTLLAGEKAEIEVFGRQVLPRVHARSDREQLYRSVVHHGPAGELAHVVAKQTVVRLVHVHRGAILQLSAPGNKFGDVFIMPPSADR